MKNDLQQPTPWQSFRADRARYPRNAWFAERSLWAVAVYRFGQAILTMPWFVRVWLRTIYRAMVLTVQIVTNIEINTQAKIGPGLRIHHAGPIVIGKVTLGSECTLRLGNILGTTQDGGWPVLGDRVFVGAGAQILGGVKVGDDAVVGAMSLVLHDVPAGSVVAGIPARKIG